MSAPMSVSEEMWREQTLCDALLNVAGTQLWAHKLVLCGCSTFFRSLFSHWSSPDEQEFDIPGVSADIMEIILDYAYTRVVHVTQENLMELFEAADFFDISGITQACYQAMEESLSPSSCITTWELTHKYYNPHLRNQAFLYILKHFEEVMVNSNVFLGLSLENLCSIIVEDQLNVKDESIVCEAVLKWIGHAPQERNKSLVILLSKIRLALVPPEYFTQHVRHSILVQNDPACKALVMQLDAPYLARPRLPQEFLLVISGSYSDTLNFESYDNRAKCWVSVAKVVDKPRTFHGTVFLHGSVYVIGGWYINSSLCNTHKYDLVNHTWQEVACMHTPRCHVSTALLDGFIYAMGGYDGPRNLNTAEKYSPDDNQWTMIAPMNEQRSKAGSTAYNGKIYICGGSYYLECLSTAECYDPLTNQWTMISEMSSRRCRAGVTAYSNEIYVVGGLNGEDPLTTVEAYNPNTDTWDPRPPLLLSKGCFRSEVVEDKLYALGGYYMKDYSYYVESFDVKTEMWSLENPIVIDQHGLDCCVVYDLPNMADYSAFHSSPPAEVPEEVPEE